MIKTTNYQNQVEMLPIIPIQQPMNAEIEAPPSKSITHRVLIIAALAVGKTVIRNPLFSEDTNLTCSALQRMGAVIQKVDKNYVVIGTGGKLKAPDEELYLKNSGTSLRFLISIASLVDGPVILSGNERMCQRPIKGLLEALKDLGVTAICYKNPDFPPVKILSKLIGGTTKMSGDVSSQYFSSILIAAPYAKTDITIFPTTSIKSRPYIDITVNIMKDFGVSVDERNNFFIKAGQTYKATNFKVEGDFSSVSYFFAACAILGGQIRITNLNIISSQGDKILLEYLSQMGCSITSTGDYIELKRDPSTSLKGIEVDMKDFPDIVQTLAIVACFASSSTTIKGIEHLKYKETDRLDALAKELLKLGIISKVSTDSLEIYPSTNMHGATIETYDDHRMAMSFAIMGLKLPGIVIKNPMCVEKSFPEFFKILNQIRGV